MFAMHEYFDKIKGYTMCSFRKSIKRIGDTECNSQSKGEYQLNPFADPKGGQNIFRCNNTTLTGSLKKKLDFICNLDADPLDYFLLISIGGAAFGLICCLVSTVLIIRIKINQRQEFEEL